MTEWVLIIVLNIAGQPGEIRDPSISVLGGFTSQARCEAAGQKIAERAVGVVGRARGVDDAAAVRFEARLHARLFGKADAAQALHGDRFKQIRAAN